MEPPFLVHKAADEVHVYIDKTFIGAIHDYSNTRYVIPVNAKACYANSRLEAIEILEQFYYSDPH